MSSKSDDATDFPYPIAEYGSEPYWEACNDERLTMQRCSDCNRLRWHPSPLCGECGSTNYRWETLSGRGRINSWTVVTHPVHPAAVDKVPYIVALIEIEEQAGLTMVSNLIDCAPDRIEFDLPVEVGFMTHANGQKLPVFKVTENAAP